mmetsp:Transcript_799/g.2191  ORF Transcript_799/g.2191 Transcript_799/m.2191 type:complete len:265 (-) Transcript_799:344-1138(-)
MQAEGTGSPSTVLYTQTLISSRSAGCGASAPTQIASVTSGRCSPPQAKPSSAKGRQSSTRKSSTKGCSAWPAGSLPASSSLRRPSSSRQMPTRMAMTRRTLPMVLLTGKPRPNSSSALPSRRCGWREATEGSKSTMPSAAKKESSSDCRPKTRTQAATPRVASASASAAAASSGAASRRRWAARSWARPRTSLQSVRRSSSSRSTHEPQSSTQRVSAGALSAGSEVAPPPMMRLRRPGCLWGSGIASSKPGIPLTLKFPGCGSA